ncbi:MAG: nicotinate-nucleotide--dimethylbenzimidazole phosphoribosyltransferase [Lachnospiraceae bacterium]|nr:nicotinate-nucleotide--dimethylbenzimidazole phosphoribosyltransferase [Lachnospiraceae bacterium]
MEYLGTVQNDDAGTGNHPLEALRELKIDAPDERIRKKVLENWDHVAKPLDGMGRFESLTAQIGAILGTDELAVSGARKAVIIMCADNGIVEEGVSQSGREVTLAVVKNMAKQQSSVGKMAAKIGADTIPVDIGVSFQGEIAGVVNRKIRCGTRNFRKEPAMTQEEACRALYTGIEMVKDCRQKGYRLLATGEMGIGNTTTSSAVAASLLDCDVAEVTGRGAGLSDGKLIQKQQIIAEAIGKYQLRGAEPLQVLCTVGGFDIAGLAGVCIGGALFHVPIVLDGVISMVAALVAERIVPGTRAYLIPSHKGKEPAVEMLAAALGLEPVIDASMALGEGTGAVMMMALLDMVLCIYNNRTTFSDIEIAQYERFV